MFRALGPVALLALLFVAPVSAQQFPIHYVGPPYPTTADEVILGIEACGQTLVGFTVVGHSIEIQSAPGSTLCGTWLPIEVHIGHLLPGQYTARVAYTSASGVVFGPEKTFEVTLAPQHIPTAKPVFLAVIALAPSLAGAIVLRKTC